MKYSSLFKSLFLFILLVSLAATSKAQQNNDLLKMLVKKNIISQKEADSLRADTTVKSYNTQDKTNQHGISIGSRALQISGLIQGEYEGFQQQSANNTFLLHRARLDIKGDVSDNWSYEVYTEFAGGTPKLLDAYATYRVTDFLKFTAGQFKVPFSLESTVNDSQLDFIDRAAVINALTSRSTDVIGNNIGRDIGIQASGSFVKINHRYLFDYQLALLNGAGYDVTSDNNKYKDLSGRLTFHPVKDLDISADFYNGVGFYGTPAKNEKRDREGLDARYVVGKLALQAEYDKGTDGVINRDGWYGQATYFVLSKLQLAAKYDTYDPNTVESNVRMNTYTGGFNYFFNKWARFAANYVDRREQGVQTKNNIFETQLQLTF
ncbi:porin [Pedobacter sp. L105]|uniref:porin n=1 Tax=Pedobacter sp. L105 TaxID=1641871 RepID=UPI00131C2978|nr:porin [Pedobacter sp. L105]